MELRVERVIIPEIINFNFEELKQEIEERVKTYETLVYTSEQIKEAKADVANLRKFTKALSDERIRVKKAYLKPYDDFEAKIKVLDGIVGNAVKNIDSQIKAFDEQKKAEKKAEIESYWERVASPDHPLTLERVFNAKWLNATTSMKAIQDEISCILENFAEELVTLQNLPEFSFEAVEIYKSSFDFKQALNEAHRLSELAKKKAEYEQTETQAFEAVEEKSQKVQQVKIVETKYWIGFKANLTVSEALELAEFFKSRGIEYQQISE